MLYEGENELVKKQVRMCKNLIFLVHFCSFEGFKLLVSGAQKQQKSAFLPLLKCPVVGKSSEQIGSKGALMGPNMLHMRVSEAVI